MTIHSTKRLLLFLFFRLSHWLIRSYKTGAENAIREEGMGIRRYSLNDVIFKRNNYSLLVSIMNTDDSYTEPFFI